MYRSALSSDSIIIKRIGDVSISFVNPSNCTVLKFVFIPGFRITTFIGQSSTLECGVSFLIVTK